MSNVTLGILKILMTTPWNDKTLGLSAILRDMSKQKCAVKIVR